MLRVFVGLAQNIALLLSLAFVYSLIAPRLRRAHRRLRGLLTGVLFGAIAVLGMLMPIEMAPGVIIDGRVVVVALAGLFNGLLAGATAGALVSAYRWWLGGAGTLPGVGAILTATALGVWVHRRRGAGARDLGPGGFLLLGAALAASGLVWTLALPDSALAWRTLRALALPVGVFYPLDTLLLGILLSHLLHQRERLTLTRFAFDHSPDAVFRTDPTGRLVEVNHAAVRLSGYPLEELLALHVWDLAVSGPREAWPAVWRKAREEGGGISETSLRTRDGRLVAVEMASNFIRHEGAEYLCLFLRDITRRKRAEEATKALAEVGQRPGETLDPEAVGRLMTDRVRTLFHAHHATLFRLEEGSGDVVVIAVSGDAGPVHIPREVFPGGGLARVAVRERRPVLTMDLLGDARVDLTPELRTHIEQAGFGAVLSVPLVVQDRVIGVLGIADRAGRAFTDEEVRVAQAFADRAALALQNAELFAESERRRRSAEALLEIARALGSTREPKQVLAVIAQQSARAVGTERCLICLWQDGRIAPVTAQYADARADPAQWARIKALAPAALDEDPAQAQAIRTRSPVAIDDAATSPLLMATLVEAFGVRAALVVPLVRRGQVIGTLNFADTAAPRRWRRDEIDLAVTIANQAALTIESARLYEGVRVRVRELLALVEVSRAVTSTLDYQQVARAVVEATQTLLPGSACVLREALPGSEELAVVARQGFTLSAPRLRFGEGLAGVVAATRRSATSGDLPADARVLHRDWMAAEGLASAIILPLLHAGTLYGMLALFTRARHEFTQPEVRLLECFAAQSAGAIANSRLYQRVSAAKEELQTLSRRLMEVQEAERHHLARELHDEIGQALTGLKLTLEMSLRLATGGRRGGLESALAQIGDLMARTRELSIDLRPPVLDDLGLVPALLWHFERFAARTGVRVTFKSTGLEGRRCPPEVETGCYRIVQEALTNVARHAGVSVATVRLWIDEAMLNAQIEDEGSGFDPGAARGRAAGGLAGMRERAALLGGEVAIESSARAGTCVTARLPLRARAEGGTEAGCAAPPS